MEAAAQGAYATELPLHYKLHSIPAGGCVTVGGGLPFPRGRGPRIPAHRLAVKHLNSFSQIGVYKRQDGNNTMGY